MSKDLSHLIGKYVTASKPTKADLEKALGAMAYDFDQEGIALNLETIKVELLEQTNANLEGLLHEKETDIEVLMEEIVALKSEINRLMMSPVPAATPRRLMEEDLGRLAKWAKESWDCEAHKTHPRLIKDLAREKKALEQLKRKNICFRLQGNDVYFPR